MLYLACTTITSIDLAHYGVSRAKDWVSVKCGTILCFRNEEEALQPMSTRNKEHLQLAKAMTISIAYAANIGGTTTITGCSSNIILKGLADQ